MSNKFKVILGSSTKFYRGFVGAILSLINHYHARTTFL
jgi:hypothetical protein